MVSNIFFDSALIKFASQKYFFFIFIRFLPTDFNDNTTYGDLTLRFINTKPECPYCECVTTVGKINYHGQGSFLKFNFDQPDGETACGNIRGNLNMRGYGGFIHELLHALGMYFYTFISSV